MSEEKTSLRMKIKRILNLQNHSDDNNELSDLSILEKGRKPEASDHLENLDKVFETIQEVSGS